MKFALEKTKSHFGSKERPFCLRISSFIDSTSCRIRVSETLWAPNPNSLRIDRDSLWFFLYTLLYCAKTIRNKVSKNNVRNHGKLPEYIVSYIPLGLTTRILSTDSRRTLTDKAVSLEENVEESFELAARQPCV